MATSPRHPAPLSRAWLFAGALALGALGGLAAGCQDQGAPAPSASSEGRPVVDTTLVAFLSKARAANHAADLSITNGDRQAAIKHLRRVTEAARPRVSPEVVEVLADAHARLGELLAEEGDFQAASREVDAGLALATEVTLFRANLFMARGVVQERRMKALEQAGDTSGAAAARAAALTAFETAMTLQEKVIEEALADEPRE